jgi:hypothetical protein
VIWLGVEIKKKKIELWMSDINGKVNEFGQIHLLIFKKNSSRKMKELGSHGFGFGSFH